MTDIVDIGLRVDSTSVKEGTRALDDLGNKSKETKSATDNYVESLKRQEKMLGMTAAQVKVFESESKKLAAAQKASTQASN